MANTDDRDEGIVSPLMPTGSGVADLEIAREQDALAAAAEDPEAVVDTIDPPEQAPMDDAAGGPDAARSAGTAA